MVLIRRGVLGQQYKGEIGSMWGPKSKRKLNKKNLPEWSFQPCFLPSFLQVGFLNQNQEHPHRLNLNQLVRKSPRIGGGKLLAKKKLFMQPTRFLTWENPEPAACPTRSLGLRIQSLYLAKQRQPGQLSGNSSGQFGPNLASTLSCF